MNVILFIHDEAFVLPLVNGFIEAKCSIKSIILPQDHFAPEDEVDISGDSFRCWPRSETFSADLRSGDNPGHFFLDTEWLWSNAEIESVFSRLCDFLDPTGAEFTAVERRWFFYDAIEKSMRMLREAGQVDFVFFSDNPHCPLDVCFCMIAEKLGIKVIILRETHIRGRFFLQDGLFSKINPIDLSIYNEKQCAKDIKDYIKRTIAKQLKPLPDKAFHRDYRFVKKTNNRWWRFLELLVVRHFFVESQFAIYLLKRTAVVFLKFAKGEASNTFNPILYDTLKTKGQDYRESKNDLISQEKILIKGDVQKRRLLLRYNDLCIHTDPKHLDEYVYFPLHYQPEATTYPYASLAIDQIVALRMLRSKLDDGIKIVVKEHPDTFNASREGWVRGHFSRPLDYYERILELPNTALVPIETNTNRLIAHAKFIATLTGTTALEAALNGVPSIVFGHAWFEDCPGIQAIRSVQQLEKYLEKMPLTGGRLQVEASAYIEALETVTFRIKRDGNDGASLDDLTFSARQISKAAIKIFASKNEIVTRAQTI